jgi:hypothetical protein
MFARAAVLFRTLSNPLLHLFERLFRNPVRLWFGEVLVLSGEDGQE